MKQQRTGAVRRRNENFNTRCMRQPNDRIERPSSEGNVVPWILRTSTMRTRQVWSYPNQYDDYINQARPKARNCKYSFGPPRRPFECSRLHIKIGSNQSDRCSAFAHQLRTRQRLDITQAICKVHRYRSTMLLFDNWRSFVRARERIRNGLWLLRRAAAKAAGSHVNGTPAM